MGTIETRRRPQPVQYDVEDDDSLYVTRMPGSARRYKSAPPAPIAHPDTQDEPITQQGTLIQRRRSSLTPRNTNGMVSNAIAPSRPRVRQHKKRFPAVTLLLGMVVTVLLIMSVSALSSWWRTYQDDLHYGRPRTSQLDAVVGHDDSPAHPTHFIFINLHRHVEIIEIPGGDPARTRIFSGPILYGNGQDLTPVTGEVRDVNGDGKPDLIVHIQDQQIILLNDGTTFHPQGSS
jgi:hypothetical protein